MQASSFIKTLLRLWFYLGHNKYDASELLNILLDMEDKGETVPYETMTRQTSNENTKASANSRAITGL